MSRSFLELSSIVSDYNKVGQTNMPAHLISPTVDWTLLRRQFTELQRQLAEEEEADLDSVLDGSYKESTNSEDESEEQRVTVAERIERAQKYAERLDTALASSPTGHAFVNGKHHDLDDVGSLFFLARHEGSVLKAYGTELPETTSGRNDIANSTPTREGNTIKSHVMY